MNHGPVQDCSQILSIIYTEKINIREIIRRTGLHKQRVFNAKKIMLKSGLVKETKDPNHKQKIILRTTTLGDFVVKFILLIDNFEKAFENFDNKMRKYGKSYIAKSTSVISPDRNLIDGKRNDTVVEISDNTIISIQKLVLNVLIEMSLYYYELFRITFPINKYSSGYLQKTINMKLQVFINNRITLREEIFGHEFAFDIIEKIGKISNERKENKYAEDNIELIQQAFDKKIFNILSIIRENIENRELISNLNELTYCLIDFTDSPHFYIQKLISIEKGVLISLEAIDSTSPEQLKKARENKDKMLEFYNELSIRAKHLGINNQNNLDSIKSPSNIQFKK